MVMIAVRAIGYQECLLSFQNVASSSGIHKDLKVKRHPTAILPVIFMDVKYGSH